MKLNLKMGGGSGNGGIKPFFVNHVEKLILGVTTLAAILLVVFSLGGDENYKANWSPTDLEQQVENARREMNASRWDEVHRPQFDKDLRLPGRAKDVTTPVAMVSYQLEAPWRPLYAPPRTRRVDPELYTVEQLEVRPGRAAIEVQNFGEPNRADDAEMLLAPGKTRALSPSDRDRIRRAMNDQGAGESEGFHFVSLTGLIPFERQFEQYKTCFSEAASYDQSRDFPNYLHFKIQRATVQRDGTLSNWQDLDPFATSIRSKFQGSADEIAHEDYVIQEERFQKTGYELPPVVLPRVDQWALHSKIPRRKTEEEQFAEESEVLNESELDDRRGFQFGQPANGESTEHENQHETIDEYDSSEPRLPITEFKLFRYFDYTVEPGKSYRYRVQLLIEDPNNPEMLNEAPNPQSLEPEVAARLQEQGVRLGINPNRGESETATGNNRKYWRLTDWSEPSPIATVAPRETILAGGVDAAKTSQIVRTDIRYTKPLSEPSATVLVMRFDEERAAEIPAEIEDVHRGQLLNSVTTVEYLSPSAMNLVTIENYNLQSNSFVADIRGGDPLPGRLSGPGEILIYNSQGQLAARDEFSDSAAYEWNTFEPPAAESIERAPLEDEEIEERGGRRRSSRRRDADEDFGAFDELEERNRRGRPRIPRRNR